MPQARFLVVNAGPLVTYQDSGRPGMLRYGVPSSGPMDRSAYEIAHAALGNSSGAPAIEVSVGGLTLDCVEGAVGISIAGGGFQVAIDGVSYGSWVVATFRAGSRLTIRPGAWGSWTYLALAGALKSKFWLGSCSTHAASGLGGGHLAAGQFLEVDDAALREERTGETPVPDWARTRGDFEIVRGPQDRFFSQATLELLEAEPFALTDAYDRMGVRLSGPPLPVIAALDMPSEAITRGSLQVAGDGVATVLLADHQTTGGYPKIATLVSDQIDALVQQRSRSQIRFVSVSPAAAVENTRRRHGMRQRHLLKLREPPTTLAYRLMSANLIDGVVSGSAPF